MQISEMRSALNIESKKRTGEDLPPSMPDWAVRHAYERRNGLQLTPLPADVLKRADASRQARLQRALDAVATGSSAQTMKRLRDRYANLFETN
jgi:hypothetical protein